MTTTIRNNASALALLAAMTLPFAALAQQSTEINIPAQPLQQALDALATQTGVQVVTTKPVVNGIVSKPVEGAATASEALLTMLRGTRLEPIVVGADSFAVTRNFVSQNATDDDAIDLGTLILRGDRLGRDVGDVSPGTTVIAGNAVESASLRDFFAGGRHHRSAVSTNLSD